jgi:glycosyltransferase domain-containing protein
MMQIHNPAVFSVLVPTFNGTRYVRRMLDYFRQISFKGQIVLSDNSTGEHRAFVDGCEVSYPELNIVKFLFAENIRFLDKLVATLEKLDSQFVMLHAHDDFLIPASVEGCVGFLQEHTDYSVARGRVAMFALERAGAAEAAPVSVALVPHPMRGYEHPDPFERVIAHVERFAPTFYSVHRRASLIESFRFTEEATKNVIFFQYLSSCLAVLAGRVWCSDELFYVRQGHADSWSGRLNNGRDHEHWPMLITSPHFSNYYQQFRAALLQRLIEYTSGSAETVAQRLDLAAVSLFKRGFCGQDADNPGEVRFLKNLNDQGTREYAGLASIVDFVVAYPDTY